MGGTVCNGWSECIQPDHATNFVAVLTAVSTAVLADERRLLDLDRAGVAGAVGGL